MVHSFFLIFVSFVFSFSLSFHFLLVSCCGVLLFSCLFIINIGLVLDGNFPGSPFPLLLSLIRSHPLFILGSFPFIFFDLGLLLFCKVAISRDHCFHRLLSLVRYHRWCEVLVRPRIVRGETLMDQQVCEEKRRGKKENVSRKGNGRNRKECEVLVHPKTVQYVAKTLMDQPVRQHRRREEKRREVYTLFLPLAKYQEKRRKWKRAEGERQKGRNNRCEILTRRLLKP